jgi:uncharacterized lipoprotein
MKKIILGLSIVMTLAACGNSDNTKETNPSDTTGTNVNPAVEDPNSNMADTMKMKDSTRVKDTTIKDNTSQPKKH